METTMARTATPRHKPGTSCVVDRSSRHH